MKKQKLELTWTGKENRPKLEPRILIEDSKKSYHAAQLRGENDIFDNRLIFGDNLLALKALEQEFVVETTTGKFLCEPKRASEVSDDLVRLKAGAATLWCERATIHAQDCGTKPWTYLLIPHDQITASMSLSGLAARCAQYH